MLYLAALLSKLFYFRLPIWRNAPEVNTLLRTSKAPCAASNAKVPKETTFYYEAARLLYNNYYKGLCPQWSVHANWPTVWLTCLSAAAVCHWRRHKVAAPVGTELAPRRHPLSICNRKEDTTATNHSLKKPSSVEPLFSHNYALKWQH